MKMMKWIMAATMVAGMAQATVETNFFANFEGSTDGAATKTNLDAGTPTGFWLVDNVAESFITNNAGGGVVAFEVGKYTNTAVMAVAPDLADGVTLSFDVRSKGSVASGVSQNSIVLRNSANVNLISLQYSTSQVESNAALRIFITGPGWVTLSNAVLSLPEEDLASGTLDTIKLELGAGGFTVYANDVDVSGYLVYNTPDNATDLGRIFFSGIHNGCSVWYDDVLVTSTKTKETYLYADFNNSADGTEGSATAENLNAGTAVGSWTVEALEESYVTNGLVAWDNGKYTNTATLATAANLSDNPVFSYDVRSKRAAASLGGKASALRVQDENGATIINMSYSTTSSAGQLRVWDAVASAWTNLTDSLLGNSVIPPSTMEHIDVEMGAAGFTVYTNGTAITGLMSYNSTNGSQVASIKFFGVHGSDTTLLSGCWYDNIKVQGPLVTNAPATGYAAWIEQWAPADLSDPNGDADNDGLLNIYEYGLGGDPTNAANRGTPPTFGAMNVGGTNYFGYIYPQLAAAQNSGLSYYLELNTAGLVASGAWTNSGYLVYGTNVTGEAFDFVTNITTTVESTKFIRLKIESL